MDSPTLRCVGAALVAAPAAFAAAAQGHAKIKNGANYECKIILS